ncbi:MAG TPA: hypothetical protein VGB03_06795 [Acidimicrobiales bacterium]|jgi:hypothetical protein
MVRRSFRIGLRVGLLAGIAAAVARAVQSRRSPSPAVPEPVSEPVRMAAAPEREAAAEWPPIQQDPPQPPAPEVPNVQAESDTPPPVRKAATKKAPATKKAAPRTRKAAAPAPAMAPATAWVEPTGAVCPPSHPVKAKLSSRLFHLPGMFAYARTVPDRCYSDAEAAEADGLARAKR